MQIHTTVVGLKQLFEMSLKMRIFTRVKNWDALLKDYFNYEKNGDYFVYLRKKGTLKLRLGTTDKWSVHEIVLRDDYKISELPKGKLTIVDLGANAGVFTVYAALVRPKATIYSYEPEDYNFSYLKENVKRNHLTKVKVFKLACSDKAESRKLYKGSDNRSYSFVKKSGKPTTVVKAVTLKQIFEKNKIEKCDLLKMDIESSEYKVLYNAPVELLRKIQRINLEYHNGKNKQNTGSSLEKYLVKKGFNVSVKDSLDGKVGMIYAERKTV